MSLGVVIIIILLILVILYFAHEPFQTYVKSLWSDSSNVIDKNKKEQEKLDEKQKIMLQKLEEKEQKLADIKEQESMKIEEENFMSEYKRLEEEIENTKNKIKLKQVESIEDIADTIDSDLLKFELSLKQIEQIKSQCVEHDNEYTKSISLSSGGACQSTCKDFDPKTLQQIESKDGICKIGNTCYYEHHKWSDLHQSCIQDYKLHVKTNEGECYMIIDDVSYHISTTPVLIPIHIHRGGKYNEDQSKWGFYYRIEPITTNALTNELCLKRKGGFDIRKKEQKILHGIVMLSNNDWYRSTHIEWNILHSA